MSSSSIAPDRSTQSAGPPQLTLDDVRNQAAREVARRAIDNSRAVGGVRMAVLFALAKADDQDFLRRVAEELRKEYVPKQEYVFALATTGTPLRPNRTNTLIICGSPDRYVHSAILLASAKFTGRITTTLNEGHLWFASIRRIDSSGPSPTIRSTDEAALWDALVKSSRPPMDALDPPPGSMSSAARLAFARTKLQRLSPRAAFAELRAGGDGADGVGVNAPTFLVDIRAFPHGRIQGSLMVDRNSLEWCFDPQSEERFAIADRYDLRIILFDEDGRASSLAAVALQEIGLLNATDIVGGFNAWVEEGLPADITGLELDLDGDEIALAGEGELRSEPSIINILD
ncbi:Rhodanese domain-containing protein [Mycena kentingensis (nom. inval.)]|nr:Rhodanese domain-containing protein [Mycena kentingensis (nom. inval.)]